MFLNRFQSKTPAVRDGGCSLSGGEDDSVRNIDEWSDNSSSKGETVGWKVDNPLETKKSRRSGTLVIAVGQYVGDPVEWMFQLLS